MSTERVRRYRLRQTNGLRHARVFIYDFEVIELERLGILPPGTDHTEAELGAAVGKLLDKIFAAHAAAAAAARAAAKDEEICEWFRDLPRLVAKLRRAAKDE